MTEASQDAQVSVVVLGGTSRRSYEDEFADNGAADGPAVDTTNGEGVDLAAISLPEAQLDVVRAAGAAGRPVIAVVIDGRPRALTTLLELADAVLFVPFPGPSATAPSSMHCSAPVSAACSRRRCRWPTGCCPSPTTSAWRRHAGTSTIAACAVHCSVRACRRG